MRRFGVLGLVLTVASLSFGQGLSAQSLRDNGRPAELPPASYPGTQYVDSRGCVFIRARSGASSWVPRVRRDRTVICGQRPSLTPQARTQTAAAAPRAATAPAPRVVAPAPTPRAVAPVAAAPTTVRQAQPVQQPARVAAQPVQIQPATRPAATTSAQQGCRVLATTGVCAPNAWAPRNDLARSGPIVANPQIVQPGTVQRSESTASLQRRVVSAPTRTVVTAPRSLTHGSTDTQTYRQSWEDGRLNPTRGLRSVATATPTQVQRSSVSTRSGVPSSHRYVQAGTYSVPSNAQTAGHRLQRLGLPVRILASGRHQVVVVGPISNTGTLRSALDATRRAGFSDAFTRR